MNSQVIIQYERIKAKYPDALLLFRVGDFYEVFKSDAILVADVLDIVLINREEYPCCGFPAHALDIYLSKLVKKGFRVAICDQLEEPKGKREPIKRGVTELMSPSEPQPITQHGQLDLFNELHQTI